MYYSNIALWIVFLGIVVECIYSFSQISIGSNDYIHFLTNNNLEPIAKLVVDGWISSDSHREAISKDWYNSTTVATIIQIDKKRGFLKLCHLGMN